MNLYEYVAFCEVGCVFIDNQFVFCSYQNCTNTKLKNTNYVPNLNKRQHAMAQFT